MDWKNVNLGFVLGLSLAGMVAGNAVMTYSKASQAAGRRTARTEIATQLQKVDQQIRTLSSEPVSSPEELAARLDEVLTAAITGGRGRLAWIQLVNAQGQVIAKAGEAQDGVFNSFQLDEAFRAGHPAVALHQSKLGPVWVEASPFHLRPSRSVTLLKAVDAPRHPLGSIELAAFLVPSSDALWTARRNLAVSLMTALCLIGCVFLLRRTTAGEQRMQHQLDLAAEVQAKMQSSSSAVIPDFAIATERRTAGSVGGDFCDVYEDANGRAAFILGDVCGKDVPAAMLAGMLQGAARSSHWTASPSTLCSATRSLNTLMCERAGMPTFATMFWGYVEPGSQTLIYVNAGHCVPMLIRRGEAIPLTKGGCALGLFPEARFEAAAQSLEFGDLLVLFSDGIVEAEDRRGLEYGEDRLVQRILTLDRESPATIGATVFAEIEAFANRPRPADDQTLLIVRYAADHGTRHAIAEQEMVGAVA